MGVAMRQPIRKIVTTILIGAMLFFAPSMMPSGMLRAASCGPQNVGWLATDTALAGVTRFIPCPPNHSHTPAWPWVVIGCAGSIVLSALVANYRDNRQLTTSEAWTCGLLYWFQPYQAQPAKAVVRAKG
jgi:hypothetical protein